MRTLNSTIGVMSKKIDLLISKNDLLEAEVKHMKIDEIELLNDLITDEEIQSRETDKGNI